MASVRIFILLLLSIALASSSAAADSIHGCGGFVQASPTLIRTRKASDAKLDYSHVTVELRTVDGLLKDRTQCAPNGYYFIPVYDKGSFIVKVRGPSGWSWEPETVSVAIDQNGCNANADINFQFTGFTISGKVKGAVGGDSCSLKDDGPPDVKVELLSPLGESISSVLTSERGDYTFTNVSPGEYKLSASHPSLQIELRGSSEVNLGFGNAVVDDIFFIPGYDIRGFVVSQGNPILGVHVYLYSDDVSEVYCPQGSGKSPIHKNALCHAVSDAEGKFTFKSIPCGHYELLPYYKGENTIFDVSPPSLNISVEHHHTTVPQKFQVTGFSVGGRVIDGNDVGIEGVKIILDGQLKAITDIHGYYKLDQVNSKHYSVAAEKDHYKFSNLDNFLVLPNMASIEDIRAISYDVCGVVRLNKAKYKTKVSLTHGPANVKPQIRETDESGQFCFQVPPGEYRLSAMAMKSESFPLLFFSPPYIDVTVDKPLFNVEFLQAQVSIHGAVVCKDKCSPSVSISLFRSDGMESDERTISLDHENGNFMFHNVFPGKYKLQVKHVSPHSMEDNWCWHKNIVELDVGVEDIKGIEFVQNGYWITIDSTHDVDAYIHQPDASLRSLKIKKGTQKICVEHPGLHELHFVNSCIFFGDSSVEFDSLNPLPLHLTGRKYLLKGVIHITSSLDQDGFDLAKHIVLDVLNKDHVLLDSIQVRYLSVGSGEIKSVLEYSMWADRGEDLIFVPRDTRTDGEKIILFYPRERYVSVVNDGCQATIAPIVGRTGLYIEGSVTPTLSGVDIKIIAEAESRNAPLLKGEIALETKTEVDGSFTAGPLYDDATYSVKASKSGYHLKQVEPNLFSCQKLSQILVHIYDREEVKELFPSVLLSLSGEDGYRNNSVTGVGGQFVFDSLFPGSFYLRPLLKEYSFDPPALAIELGAGEHRDVTFYATRVAYSAIGSVSLLSGQPKEGIHVEARSDSKGHYEETVTDSFGNYRLRGLIPETDYVIRVVAKDDTGSTVIERASPEYMIIHVGSEDIEGLDFVAFEHPDSTILSGHVQGNNLEALQPHLSVEVRLGSDPTKIETVIPLPLSYYFQIRDLPKGRHLLKLVLHSPSIIHRFQSDILEVDLEQQPQIHVGPLTYMVGEYHQKQELTPAPVFPLIMGVCVIFLFMSMPRLKDLYQFAVGIGSAAVASRKEQRKPPVLKKRVS